MLVKYVSKRKINLQKAKLKDYVPSWSGLYRFSKAEIENAINYRNEKTFLGRGSAGHVYKGVLPSGQVVAIKHINKKNEAVSFRREVEGLSMIRHPNLVCLFGFCIEGDCHYLVYEYCPGGNLAQQLQSTYSFTLPLINVAQLYWTGNKTVKNVVRFYYTFYCFFCWGL